MVELDSKRFQHVDILKFDRDTYKVLVFGSK
jgi:hypothetical protein